MGQSFFQGEVEVRLLLEGAILPYAIPRERLATAAINSNIPVRSMKERFTSYFWVKLSGQAEDERGPYYVASRVVKSA